jgi:hypothetical protein
METWNGDVSRQNSFAKEGAGFFSTNGTGGKNKSCPLYIKINSACQEKSVLPFEYSVQPR